MQAIVSHEIDKPEILVPMQKTLPIINYLTKDIIDIGSKYVIMKDEITRCDTSDELLLEYYSLFIYFHMRPNIFAFYKRIPFANKIIGMYSIGIMI